MSSSIVPSVEFHNGYKMPMFGLGTYLSKPGELEEAVKYAIEIGYRHIDAAYFYQNEKQVGDGIREKIKDGTIKREDIFLTTKLWNTFHKEELVVPACKESLKNLGLDYIDLYLIHWPIGYKEGGDLLPKDSEGNIILSDVDYLETWRGMEECVRQGLTRSIGISNFNSEQITRLLGAAKIKPVNNQIEVNVNVNQQLLIEFCKKNDITVTGFSPLGRPGNRYGIKNTLDHPIILELSKKYGKTPEQIAFRFVFQQGAAPIPKSVTKSRIKENFEIFDFELIPEEITTIKSLGTGERVAACIDGKKSKYYPFDIPF